MFITVLDENRRLETNEVGNADLTELIRRDRNHPSVFMWSLENEEPIELRLSTDDTRCVAGGDDVVIVRVDVIDAAGRVVPAACPELEFTFTLTVASPGLDGASFEFAAIGSRPNHRAR